MNYEKAQKSDLPALTKLWQESFGDSVAAINEFWKIFDRIEVFVARENAPVAMLCALPVTYFDASGEMHAASYFYAVCTAKSHRGRGICKRLMEFAETSVESELFFLTPSSKEMFGFYRKSGYETACCHKRYEVAASGRARIRPIDAAAYQNLRQMMLYADFISYDEAILSLQTGLYRIETSEAVCCAAAEKRGGVVCLKELLPDVPEAAAALAAHLGAGNAVVCTEGGTIPFAMAKSKGVLPCPQNAYLGLAFD